MIGDNKYFEHWNHYKGPTSEYYPTESISDVSSDELYENYQLKEFINNPCEFLESNRDYFNQFIEQNINIELLENNEPLFHQGYCSILKVICFSQKKEVGIEALTNVFKCENENRDSILSYLQSKGLIRKSYLSFKHLDLLEEWESLKIPEELL